MLHGNSSMTGMGVDDVRNVAGSHKEVSCNCIGHFD